MSQVSSAIEGAIPVGGVLIVCLERNVQSIRRIITRQAHLNWEERGFINVLVIPDDRRLDESFNTSRIRARLPHGSPSQHVVVIGSIRINRAALSDRYYYLKEVKTLKNFDDKVLPVVLNVTRLDWLNFVHLSLMNGWRHGTIDLERLNAWRRQFADLGHDWVGEGLLKVLDFWLDDRVNKALDISPSRLSEFDCVCVNHHFKAGKSAGVIASLVKKQIDSDAHSFTRVSHDIKDLREAIDSNDTTSILFVEDCMITGNEMVRILLDLQNIKHNYGSPKITPLAEPANLTRKKIRLRFALVTNGSVAYVKKFLADHKLTNIEIDSTGTEEIETLTEQGLMEVTTDTLVDAEDCLNNPESSVKRAAFCSLAVWHDDDRRHRAIDFCTTIGRQLFKSYIESRGKPWPERKIAEASLGVRGLALALAFTHSVPKETLPLFWAGGEVMWNSKKTKWIPLFENAL
jgi:hypothetical protein